MTSWLPPGTPVMAWPIPAVWSKATSLEHDGRQFAVMTPEEPDENEDEEAIVILEMLDSGNGEDMELVSVDDDDLAEAVFNEYMEMMDEEEEEDGGDGGEK